MWPISYSVLGQEASTLMWPKGNLILLHRWPYMHNIIVFLKEYYEKVSFEKKSADDNKSKQNYPACKDLMKL